MSSVLKKWCVLIVIRTYPSVVNWRSWYLFYFPNLWKKLSALYKIIELSPSCQPFNVFIIESRLSTFCTHTEIYSRMIVKEKFTLNFFVKVFSSLVVMRAHPTICRLNQFNVSFSCELSCERPWHVIYKLYALDERKHLNVCKSTSTRR